MDLIAAFTGLTFLKNPGVIAHNNMFPKLILGKEHIEFRCLFTRKKDYSEIVSADIYISDFTLFGISTTNICLTFKGSIFTFVGNLDSLNNLKWLVLFLKEKGVPLTEKAKELVIEFE